MSCLRPLSALLLSWLASGVLASQPSPGVGDRFREPGLHWYPHIRNAVEPSRCPLARTFRLALEVDQQGKVGAVRVLQSTDNPALDQEMLAIARTYRFSPKIVDWQRVAFTTAIEFSLRDGPCRRAPLRHLEMQQQRKAREPVQPQGTDANPEFNATIRSFWHKDLAGDQ